MLSGDRKEVVMNAKRFGTFSFIVVLVASGCSASRPPTSEVRASVEARDTRMAVPRSDPAAAELAEEMVRSGKREYERGLFDSAQRTFEKAIEVDPRNQKAWYYLHRVRESIYYRDQEELYRRDLQRRWRSLHDVI